jgi:hypothetical protein
MPLSEHEQRLLDQMERQLYADDPKLASALRGGPGKGHGRLRLLLGGLVLLVGMGLLVGGAAAPFWPLGVLGFVVMLGGGWLVSSGWLPKAAVRGAPNSPNPGPSKAKTRPGFMDRIEERWDRRRDGER